MRVTYSSPIQDVISAGVWPTWVMSNHDIVRMVDRYSNRGRLGPREAIGKLLAGFYLTLPGTAVMYYGEEIGMVNNDPKSRSDVLDPIGKIGWPQQKGRDGERTPMQWSPGANGGFSTTKPWLPVPDSASKINVANEEKDPDSMLNFYRHVLELRKQDGALREGTCVMLNPSDTHVLAYLREYQGRAVLVAVNMSGTEQRPTFDLTERGFGEHPSFEPLLTNQATSSQAGRVALHPFGIFIAQVR